MAEPVGREWSPEEQEVIDATPAKVPRKTKLSVEQVKEIRRRVDSLTVPWTLRELADEYGVEPEAISELARRFTWASKAFEPEEFWKRKRK